MKPQNSWLWIITILLSHFDEAIGYCTGNWCWSGDLSNNER